MKIEKIYFQQNFPTGKFLFENIGVSLIVEEGEDPNEVLRIGKRWTEREHKKLHPELYQIVAPNVSEGYGNHEVAIDEPPKEELATIQIEKTQGNGKPQPDLKTIKQYQTALNKNDVDTVKFIEENFDVAGLGLKAVSKVNSKSKK